MRRIVVVSLLVIAGVVAMHAVADGQATAPAALRLGFDHDAHEVMLDKQGSPLVACTKCHAMRAGELVGKPGHAACFGACHGAAPVAVTGKPLAISDMQRPVCAACHADAELAGTVPADRKRYAVDYPPYRVAPNYSLAFGHKTHASVACTQCHAAPDAKPAAGSPHRRCAGCHDGKPGKGFAVSDCRRCHERASSDAKRVAMRRTEAAQIVVDAAFSHARHFGRAARDGRNKQCATCHPGVAETDARALPRPPMAACAPAGCHDDKTAFGVTASCTKCHRDPPRPIVMHGTPSGAQGAIFIVARPSTRFSHTTAAHAGAKLACGTCHPVGKTNEVQVAGHAPCVACHEKDFGERKPRICGACHNGTEPWRSLVADRLPAPHTEFGATIDHALAAHAKVACASCHSLTTATVQLRPPRGHDACTASGCHARAGGPSPQLTDCERCHELGLAERRDATRRAETWSVRARFDHAPHARASLPNAAAAIECKQCHVDLSAKTTTDLAAPPKSTCAPCHDGVTSFKLTGTTCTRCHPGPTK